MKYIKKVSKKSVEKFLGVKLHSNKTSIGADTATYHTAFAIIKTTSSYVILEKTHKITVPNIPRKSKSKTKKALDNVDLFTEQLDRFKDELSQEYKFDFVKIEDCFYGFSVFTTKLLSYNGILTYDRLKRIANNATLINPTSARAKVKFKKSKKKLKSHQLKKEIVEYVNKALSLELKISENDTADAIVLSLSGLVQS